jgi:DNA-binding CsgD family transcriptional regulator
LIERARSDVVARSIEALDEKTRRENATVLALQGTLHAIAGRFARAESLLRRSLSRAGSNRDLFAAASLRLASLLANQGEDITDLLRPVGDEIQQAASHRAAALSLIAGQRAASSDPDSARVAVARLEPLMQEIDDDAVRARVLHHIGIAFHHLGMPSRALAVLSQSSEIASELHLYSVASRVNAVLSNLALHEDDDVPKQLKYAEAAADAATKAGDALGLQTALLQMLSAHMSMGAFRKAVEIEKRFGIVKRGDLAFRYLTLFRAMRLSWEGRFAEAQQLVSSCWEQLPFNFERVLCGADYALFLALDGKAEQSAKVAKEVLALITSIHPSGLRRVRSLAIARVLCALAEGINGRVSFADRILHAMKPESDVVVDLTFKSVDLILARLRRDSWAREDRIKESVEKLTASGYADVAQLLAVVERTVNASATSSKESALTSSELEVLRLLAEGLVPKEISLRRACSVNTVRVHIANAIAKLGCHGRAEAIRAARLMNLI